MNFHVFFCPFLIGLPKSTHTNVVLPLTLSSLARRNLINVSKTESCAMCVCVCFKNHNMLIIPFEFKVNFGFAFIKCHFLEGTHEYITSQLNCYEECESFLNMDTISTLHTVDICRINEAEGLFGMNFTRIFVS